MKRGFHYSPLLLPPAGGGEYSAYVNDIGIHFLTASAYSQKSRKRERKILTLQQDSFYSDVLHFQINFPVNNLPVQRAKQGSPMHVPNYLRFGQRGAV